MDSFANQSSVITLPSVPSVHTPRAIREIQQKKNLFLNDFWLLVTLTIAIATSVTAWKFAYDNHWTLLYDDAHAHLAIARRVILGNPSGLAQLGGVWLPLPHLIMVPLIWSYTLWQTGLAGSFTSMLCFIVASIFIFLSARRITKNGLISFVATLAFMLNPNVLYLQSTPLSELTLAMTMAITCYYFLAWAQEDKMSDLIRAAGGAFLMSISRYDGWSIFLAAIVMVVIIGILKKHRKGKIVSNLILFSLLGGFAIFLWIVWNYLIFHDPLYFQKGPYSSQTDQLSYIQSGLDRPYHNIYFAIHDYLVVIIQTLGPLVFFLGIAGLILLLVKKRIADETIAILLFVVPIPFYMLTLFTGQTTIFSYGAVSPHASNVLYNVRYGMGSVAPASICTAIFIQSIVDGFSWLSKKTSRNQTDKRKYGIIIPIFIIPMIFLQSFLTYKGGVITLQDGQFGISCYYYSTIPGFLARHYNGGYILMDSSSTLFDISETGFIAEDKILYQGSGKLWQEALSDPSKVVDWIAYTPGDLLSRYIDITNQNFNAQFELLDYDQNTGVRLYHLRSTQPLPSRDIPPSPYQQYYQLCGTYKPGNANMFIFGGEV